MCYLQKRCEQPSAALTTIELVLALPAVFVCVASERYINTRAIPATELAPLTGALALVRAVFTLHRAVAKGLRVHALSARAFKLISHAFCACRNHNTP